MTHLKEQRGTISAETARAQEKETTIIRIILGPS